ncbi:MAG: restriction endonuclease subunit R [Desulfobacteraceae bacterium A6]|nr:MAG: restriction endonuclease subunit R [Desulfobacteraceae bacterium A6]
MNAPAEIVELIKRFDSHRESYKSGQYNETQVRREFIDPLFTSLGWDVDNKQGYAESYKDVIHEDAIKVGGVTKAPDYCFRVGGTRKFFLEAKKPSVNLKDDASPAFQLRRYAWSAKLPLSILTDFDEFVVYDCRIKPVKTDKASTARIFYLTYNEFARRWDEIASVFSREAVLKGSFDKYAESKALKKGTAEVDNAFLKEIEFWRETLAGNLALRNPQLTQRELNFAVQRTIDRLIFLRICEDRGIEDYGRLMALQNGKQVYPRLCQIYHRADERYNSGLFHFRREKDVSEPPDNLTPGLIIDDAVLKGIIKNLYYPDSPYEFSVLPADILGQVYEQFLGKVIRLTPGHRAVIEDKPEVKKAGGVYYTPTYIVDYIVRQTVGKMLDGKTPRQVAGIQGKEPPLRILDPACGSGSFLIGAYQYLLDWHRDWYFKNSPEKWMKGRNPQLCHGPGGDLRLTTAERKRILLMHIYGVDIDPQAVEVTKLSLLLKVLEGENEQTLNSQLQLFHKRALPNLSSNIKCGNSLIGSDYYENQGLFSIDGEERYRLNVFDWNSEFPEIFQKENSGFDVVIGNPPYVRQELLGDFKAYFQKHYQTFHGIADLYVYFIEKGVALLRDEGFFGIIVANKWMRANYGIPLRQWLKQQHISEIIDFGDLPVFQKATTYPCILRIKKTSPQKTFMAAKVNTLIDLNLTDYVEKNHFQVSYGGFDDKGWSLADYKTQALLDKLKKKGQPLGEYIKGKIYRGILTGLNEAFVIDAATREKLIAQDPSSAELIKPFLAGRDIKRYQPPVSDKYLIFTRRGVDIKKYPAIENYLTQFKNQLMPKPKNWKGIQWAGRKPGPYQWYEIQDTINYYSEFEKSKIIYPNICAKPEFTINQTGLYTNQKCFIIPIYDLFLLGILNSTLTMFLFRSLLPKLRGDFYEPSYVYFKGFPICNINLSDSAGKTRHDRIVDLVGQMLSLHQRLADATLDHDKNALQRQIDAADRQIDRLVYELYGLTDEEIKIVEKG